MKGLSPVPSATLERLLRLVRASKVTCPLDGVTLHLAGFADVAHDLELLKGLDRAGVEAVLKAVLLERRAHGRG